MDAGHALTHVEKSEPAWAGNWGTHLRVGIHPFWSPDEVWKQSYEQEKDPRSFSYQSWKTKNKKTKQNFKHWKISLTQKSIGSSPATVLLPCSGQNMWIWTEERENWTDLSQKSAIHLLSTERSSLKPVSGFHSAIQTSAVYQSRLLDETCPLTRPMTVLCTAASPSK